MPTYMEMARIHRSHRDVLLVAEQEGVDTSELLNAVASGSVVIVPGRREVAPVGIGHLLGAKVLCNLGTSSSSPDIDLEIEKARIAVDHGAKIVCDQSVGPNLGANRARLIDSIGVPIAAIPLYQNVENALTERGDPLAFTSKEVIDVFEQQILNGVTMPGLHTMSRAIVRSLGESKRIMHLVSRGGGLMHQWIVKKQEENPYLSKYDEVLRIAKENNVPLTFVCSLRSGTVVDGCDSEQIREWKSLVELIRRARKAGVSILVDGLGHMTMDEIGPAVRSFKRICGEIPLGVLGPAVTDRALGHEHVANAIGTAMAVWSGANYCNACYPTEHLGLPEVQDIPSGIGAALIATYAGDLARHDHRRRLLQKELVMSDARRKNRWGLMLDGAIEKVEAQRTFARVGAKNKDGAGCSICGELCPFVIAGKSTPGG